MVSHTSEDLATIGFYTLSDERAANSSSSSALSRCELLLTARCNFHCDYCRGIGGPDIPYEEAEKIVRWWGSHDLRAIRFSGGEPTLYRRLPDLVKLSRELGIQRVAVSSNGSAAWKKYETLLEAGVDDWSISLDACCAADGDAISGLEGSWDKVVTNIKLLSQRTYVTVGVVLTDTNVDQVDDIVSFADSLGVADIRVIPAAQKDNRLHEVQVSPELLEKYPVLAYRIRNIQLGRPVRGLSPSDPAHCWLALDDMAVCEGKHYPCIIYLRESGPAIGEMGPNTRIEREQWVQKHDPRQDPICSANCLDVCVSYNRRWQELHNYQ